jgi:hypothetical protein
MFSLLPQRQFRSYLYATFVLEGGHVHGSIVLQEKEYSTILYHHQEETTDKELFEKSRIENFMLTGLRRCGEKVLRDGLLKMTNKPKLHLDKVVIVFGAPWTTTEEKIIQIKNEQPFLVTDELISEELKKHDTESPEWSTLEEFINEIKANGYKVASMKGKKSKEIEVSIYKTKTTKTLEEKVKEEVSFFLPHVQVQLHSTTFVASRSLRAFNAKKEVLLILPDDEITELMHVSEESITGSVSIPYGPNSLLRGMAFNGKMSLKSLRTKLELFHEGTLDEEKKKDIEALMQKTTKEWKENIKEGLWGIKQHVGIFEEVHILQKNHIAKVLWKHLLSDKEIESYFEKDNIHFWEESDFRSSIRKTGSSTIDIATLSTVFYLRNI